MLGLLGRDAGAPGGAGGCETDVRDGAPKVWPVFVDRTQTVQVYVTAESLEEAWERAHEALRDPDTVERVCLMLDESCNSDIDVSVGEDAIHPRDVDPDRLVGPPQAPESPQEAFERSLAAAAAPGAGAARGRTM